MREYRLRLRAHRAGVGEHGFPGVRRFAPARVVLAGEGGDLGAQPVDLVGHAFQCPVDVAHPVAAQGHGEPDRADVRSRHAAFGQLGG